MKVERRLTSMGTSLAITVSGRDRAAALEASEKAVREIARVEDLLTTWRPGGPLYALNASPAGSPVALPPEISSVLAAVFEWSARTDGAFDPTVLPLVSAWGLRGRGRIPTSADLSRARMATGTAHFRLEPASAARLTPSCGIDEGAWGKGYALDRAAAALREAGVEDAVLDLGGQVLAIGRAEVAIADPRDRAKAFATLDAANRSVSTSGNSERGIAVGGRRIGHLLDPRTGRPAPDFGSATALAPSGLVADVLSTAFFVLGPEKGLELSERLRRGGFGNEVLYLIVKNGGVETLASPGVKFSIEEE
ncbi:MAG TPA: FAD:protein FMN transferase [Thermoanaerobaculia bacterium]|nr:FAD:protein FMN transferase [Thermoanaerobaculia bacterium]